MIESEVPTNQQLFEMVANLRDQMDVLNRKVETQRQTETFPQWYLPSNYCLETDAVFIVRESPTLTHTVFRDGRLLKWSAEWKDKGQKRITEDEAMALLRKSAEPVESPDDWVTQDRVPYRTEFDECRWSDDDEWCSHQVTPACYRHGYESGWKIKRKLQVRCRRKDLPPLPRQSFESTVATTITVNSCLEAKDGDPKGETTFEIRDSSERKTIEDFGITYGGRGPGGEYYIKEIDHFGCVVVWTESNDGERFSAEELEAIAADKRKRDQLAREPRISPS